MKRLVGLGAISVGLAVPPSNSSSGAGGPKTKAMPSASRPSPCRNWRSALGRYEDESAAVEKILAPFDIFDHEPVSCAPHYGRIRGETIGAMDLLIAAHALGLDATIVTNNLAHFRRVSGLKVTDWR